MLRRLYSTKVAIVGSGPGGFYTAHRLLSKNPGLAVSVFEKYPTPFGLSRFGVAPDHPEVKNCEDTFNEVAQSRGFQYYGNVAVGTDVSLRELQKHYNVVVFAYGCSQENKLGIPGEDNPLVLSARKFVAWYNGLPEYQGLISPDAFRGISKVSIIGNGNVAIDVARMMMLPGEVLRNTDITREALSVLTTCNNVREISIIGRRDFKSSAFTNKEFRELLELSQYGVKFRGLDADLMSELVAHKSGFDRVLKRRIDMMAKYKQDVADPKCVWSLEYLKSPVAVSSHGRGLVVKFRENEMVSDTQMQPTDRLVDVQTDLLITSIGYRGVELPGFDQLGVPVTKGHIKNVNGRVVDRNGDRIAGVYASGWIKTGSTGVIANTMLQAFNTADAILEDLASGSVDTAPKPEFDCQLDNVVNWHDWKKIDSYETAGSTRVREKVTDVAKMLEIVKSKEPVE